MDTFVRLCLTFLCLLTQVGVLANAEITNASTATYYNENTIYIHASPLGQTGEFFCGSEARPCSLPVALHRALPGSTILLEGGVYYGSYHVTKSLSIVGFPSASEGPVIFDGQHRNRIFWFDNVAARLEGVTLRNGLGDGAGCVLITRSGSQADESTVIHRCNFFNCTSASPLGVDSTVTARRAAAGAVAILYERPPVHPTMEISKCSFNNNFGRGHAKSSGAVSVHYDNEHASNAYGCAHIMLVQSSPEKPDFAVGFGFEAGIIFSRLTNYPFNGKPVYKTFEKANVARRNVKTTPLYIAYCADQGHWALSLATPGQQASVALANNNGGCLDPILAFRCPSAASECDSILMANRIYRGDLELLSAPARFVCQDLGQECRTVQVEGAVGLQSHRNGLYEIAKGSFAGRPIYRQTPPPGELRPQWLRYCVPTNEWVIGEDDPTTLHEDNSNECLRGIASVETTAIHPALVYGWRFWDSDAWRTSTYPGGITVTCAPSIVNRDYCPLLSAVNFPTTVLSIQPTLAIDPTASAHGRPMYRDPARSIHMWYCARYREWSISSVPVPAASADCVRSISSSESLVADPRQIARNKWEIFYAEHQWRSLHGDLKLRCSEDCPRIHVEVEWVPEDSGVYEAIGRIPFTYHRLYRQIAPPYNVIYFSTDSSRWLVTSDEGVILYRGVSQNLLDTTPLLSTNWSRPLDEDARVVFHVMCDTHAHCPHILVNVTSPPSQPSNGGKRKRNSFLDVRGVYSLQRYLVSDRPVYGGDLQTKVIVDGIAHTRGYLYYCGSKRQWGVGPKPVIGECNHWLSAFPGSSSYPHLWTVWRMEGFTMSLTCATSNSASGASSLATSASARMVSLVPLNPTMRARREASVSVPVSDSITDCNFTDNKAIINDEAIAAGAVAILVSRVRGGTGPVLLARRLTLRGNEGLSTRLMTKFSRAHSVGGLSVTNAAPYVTPQLFLHDAGVFDCRGHAGGLLAEGVRVFGNKVSLTRNFASHSGGGFYGYGANLTFANTMCKQNKAISSGGCGWTDIHSIVSMSRSEISNNSALSALGTSMVGGVIHIVESKVSDIYQQSIAPRSLVLSSCELSCAKNTIPVALSNGFGCIPEVVSDAVVSQEAAAMDAFLGEGEEKVDAGSVDNTPVWTTWWFWVETYYPIVVVPFMVYHTSPHIWDLIVKCRGIVGGSGNVPKPSHQTRGRRR